jgi:hypothetical protein
VLEYQGHIITNFIVTLDIMGNSYTTPFLRDSVSNAFAFFWQVYDGTPQITVRERKRLLRTVGDQYLEEIDTLPPFISCKSNRKKYYAPLRKNPVLHRKFCEINDDRELVKFASKYGLLGFTRSYEVRRRNGSQPTEMLSESLARWTYELEDLKRLVDLWDMIRSKNLPQLRPLIHRESGGIYIRLGKQKDLVDDNKSTLARKWSIEGEKPLEASLQYLTASINRKVRSSVFPTVLPEYKRKVYLLPRNLLAAMWLMFLWEVIGEVRPRRCPCCEEWFDPKRTTRITCGDTCRKRLSRQNGKNFQASN